MATKTDAGGATSTRASILPAWRVEVSAYSTILRRSHRAPKEDRTFRTRAAAERYSAARNGVMSILVPFMFWQSRVVETVRSRDWWDDVTDDWRAVVSWFRRDSGSRPSGSRPERARCEARQSGGEAASPNPSSLASGTPKP